MRTLYAFCSLVLFVAPTRAATIVVSQNGALQTLQAGVDAASAGDTILVKAGTYAGVTTIGAAKTGLSIKGTGSVILDARGAGGIALGAGIVVSATNVSIRNLTIRNADDITNNVGDGIRFTAAFGVVEKCVLRNCDGNGVSVGAPDCIVRKCTLASNNTGVRVASGNRARIDDCTFRLNDAGLFVDGSDDVLATKVRFQDQGSDDTVQVTNGLRFTLEKAKFVNCGGIVASIDSDDAIVRDVTARRVLGGMNVIGSGTTVDDYDVREFRNNMTGLLIEGPGTVATNVRVTDTHAEAIIVTSTATNAVVRNCRGTRCGLIDVATYFVDVNGAVFEDCVARGGGGDGYFVDGDGVTLTDCSAIDCVRDGFDVPPSSAGTTFDGCVAKACFAEGFENSGTNTTLTDCVASKNRIDFANDGTLAGAGITFTTGGAATPPEID